MLTYNYGIKRHLLRIFPIIIKGQVPDARIQILDKTCLMETDRPCLPPHSLRFQQVALLPCNQPAAIQELHKVVLWGGTDRTLTSHGMTMALPASPQHPDNRLVF